MSDDIGSREFWRLGHRRPWWQWNVITLLAALFVLVWARELLRLPQTATWLMCVGIVAAWFAVPAILLADRPKEEVVLVPVDAEEPGVNRLRPGYFIAAAAMFGAVVLTGGWVAGLFSVLAAVLYAAATRFQRD
jgi:hypothetical protein